MKTYITGVQTRIAFLKAIVKLFILDYILDDKKTKSLCVSTLAKVEEYIKNSREIKGLNISMQSIPVRNLLVLTKLEKVLFVLGISTLYKLECTEQRSGRTYRLHLIALNEQKAVELMKTEFKHDTVVSVGKIEVTTTALLSREELMGITEKNDEVCNAEVELAV